MNLALFDLDHTLLPLDSDYAWGEFTMQLGWVKADEFKRANDAFYAQYQSGALNVAEYVRFATRAIREQGATKSIAAREDFMRAVIQKAIKPQALELLALHRASGDTLILITATNEFVTRPICQSLGIEHLIAVELQTDASGWYTGGILGTPSFREGKVTRVEQWMAARGASWADVQRSTFYSDSMNDLSLLEKVQTPVATNPEEKLRSLARQSGWRILDLFS